MFPTDVSTPAATADAAAWRRVTAQLPCLRADACCTAAALAASADASFQAPIPTPGSCRSAATLNRKSQAVPVDTCPSHPHPHPNFRQLLFRTLNRKLCLPNANDDYIAPLFMCAWAGCQAGSTLPTPAVQLAGRCLPAPHPQPALCTRPAPAPPTPAGSG